MLLFLLFLGLEHALFDFLFLLQGLDEGALEAVGVLLLQCFLLIVGHALLANHVLRARLVALPHGREIGAALNTRERIEHIFDFGTLTALGFSIRFDDELHHLL